jgi:hypothetical protein
MRSTLLFGLAVIFFMSVSLVSAQENGLQLKMSENLTITAPPDWRLANQTRDSAEIYVPLQKERKFPSGAVAESPKPGFVIASEAGMLITIEQRRNHAEAVRRLAEIASEYPEEATPLIIAGWPAIERRYRALMPQPGEAEAARSNIQTSFATTAIAVGSTVVRFNTMLAPDADPNLLDEALAIGRGFGAPEGPLDLSAGELEEIQRMTKRPAPSPSPTVTPEQPEPGTAPRSQFDERNQLGAPVQVQTGLGELEMASSNDGRHVVIAANSGYSFSDDFGGTYTFGGGTPCNQAVCDGDPSLAVGNSGAIYYAWIGAPNANALGDGVSRSTDNGHTFPFQGLAATCPGTTNCVVADQEHIAADRANPATAGGDRVYNVWRNFAPAFSLRISCSTNSGATWTAGVPIGVGDFPRVSVGGDGFVYVAWASGGNMMLHKFNNCDAGLTGQVGWPVTVAAFTNVACPMPGLDRCNGRNILSSPTVAVDDLNPMHIYYTFATSTNAGNDDIMVYDSSDGGATFPRSVRVNNSVAGRRFMPWTCSTGGIVYVSWYDRRTATPANNDLTRYFMSAAAVQGSDLIAVLETDLSGTDDKQCSTWPCATNVTTDSESCSLQPEFAGRCSIGGVATCDFTSTICPSGGVCLTSRGCPKYGDYNGNACAAAHFYASWATATSPDGLPGTTGISIFSSTISANFAKLTVRKLLVHPNTHFLARFNLKIDGQTVAANKNGGSVVRIVNSGTHSVSETVGTGTPNVYFTVFGDDCAADGTVNLAPNDNKICTMTNFDNTGGCGQRQCCEPGDGTQGCLQCGNPSCP